MNDIRAIPLAGGEAVTLVSGNDFYSTPRVSPDGTQPAVADVEPPEHAVGRLRALGRRPRRLGHAAWTRDWWPAAPKEFDLPAIVVSGVRSCISHRTGPGWWNLYRWDGAQVDALAPMEAECGAPQWVFGLSTYAFCGDGRIALWAWRDGEWEFLVLDASGS